MRKSLLIVLAGALLAGCGQTPSPSATASSTPSASPASPSPSPEEAGRRRGGLSMERLKSQLELTDAQVQAIQPMLDEQREAGRERLLAFRREMEATLTAEQRKKLRELDQQARDAGERRQPPWEQLELTGEQAVKLEELRQKMRDEALQSRLELVEKVAGQLTPEQKPRLEQMKQRMQERARERGWEE